MINSILIIIILTPIIALLNLITNHSHFLITLLSLEGIILTLVLIIPTTLSAVGAENVATRVILLTFGACEARLGLRLMVLISRKYGSDLLSTLTSNKC